MKKVLVTGATGFVGNKLINLLLSQDIYVIATSSDISKAKSFNWFNQVEYHDLDFKNLNSKTNYYSFFNQPDLLIHLAWEGLPNYKQSFHVEENLPRHIHFLKNMIENGLKDLAVTGTCLEYGMQEGCLTESMDAVPIVAYAIAKNKLRIELTELCDKFNVVFKWVRLFYMFGKGQGSNSLFTQLDNAIDQNLDGFNMSGGEQERDFLPVEKMVSLISDISFQEKVTGVINCSSGNPIKVKQLVEKLITLKSSKIKLNLGFYPYTDYEPMRFWGDNSKLKKIINMTNPILAFIEEKNERIRDNGKNQILTNAAKAFNDASNSAQYSYNFSWMGRPIIQYPQDMVAMQEIIWYLKPDLIIETGIAHGGSLIYYASILELIGNGEVLGIDIDIREHNKNEIEAHPMFKRIQMIQGSSIDNTIVEQVSKIAQGKKKILVCLDSNHTHEHVLAEIEFYAPFVTKDSYLVVFDTIVEDLPDNYFKHERPWGIGNNPKTAVYEFLEKNKDFSIDHSIDNKLLISVAPSGYLKRIN
jgi:cephalosporin hydroxylase